MFNYFLKKLQKNKWIVIALEQDPRAKDYRSIRTKNKTALLMGNEVRGVSRALRDRCDTIAEIPMRGKKESLNVSVAFGVVVFGLIK